MGPTELPEGLDGVSVCVGGGGERGSERERGFEEHPRVCPEQLEGWSSFRSAGMLGAADRSYWFEVHLRHLWIFPITEAKPLHHGHLGETYVHKQTLRGSAL